MWRTRHIQGKFWFEDVSCLVRRLLPLREQGPLECNEISRNQPYTKKKRKSPCWGLESCCVPAALSLKTRREAASHSYCLADHNYSGGPRPGLDFQKWVSAHLVWARGVKARMWVAAIVYMQSDVPFLAPRLTFQAETARLLDDELYHGYGYGATGSGRIPIQDIETLRREREALDAICQRTSEWVDIPMTNTTNADSRLVLSWTYGPSTHTRTHLLECLVMTTISTGSHSSVRLYSKMNPDPAVDLASKVKRLLVMEGNLAAWNTLPCAVLRLWNCLLSRNSGVKSSWPRNRAWRRGRAGAVAITARSMGAGITMFLTFWWWTEANIIFYDNSCPKTLPADVFHEVLCPRCPTTLCSLFVRSLRRSP